MPNLSKFSAAHRNLPYVARARRALAVCFILSLLLHATLGPLLVWLLHFSSKPIDFSKPVRVTLSSALRIERRIAPRRPARPVKQHARIRVTRPRAPIAPSAQPPRELARITPHARRHLAARPRPAFRLTAAAIEREQVAFEQTIERARTANNPLISAKRRLATPAAQKPVHLDIAGELGARYPGEGVLVPVRSWHDGGYDYYYVRYWVQYPSGETESGVVPWPIRFPPSNDPFTHGIHHMPLPKPLPGYVLPAGITMRPLVAFCYEHRAVVASCPIAHN